MTPKDIQILKIKTPRIELPATSANTISGILQGNILAHDKAGTIEVFLRVLNDWNDIPIARFYERALLCNCPMKRHRSVTGGTVAHGSSVSSNISVRGFCYNMHELLNDDYRTSEDKNS